LKFFEVTTTLNFDVYPVMPMRVVKEISHRDCKITIFSWNNRYIIKLEQGPLEQTYKVAELEIAHEDELLKIIDSEFIQVALRRFQEMGQSLYEAVQRSSV
jgi:hypothetical protein